MAQRCVPLTAARELFSKALTQSDVAKNLNRFLIPKLEAEKYFPADVKKSDSDGKLTKGEGMTLRFFVSNTSQWCEFRYYFWVSSKSYVLTRQWNQFVDEYGLKAGDVIKFFKSQNLSGEETEKYFMLEIVNNGGAKIEEAAPMEVENREVKIKEEPVEYEMNNFFANYNGAMETADHKEGVWVFGVCLG